MKKLIKNLSLGILLSMVCSSLFAAPWTTQNAAWNVNLNANGSDPSQYYGDWPGHSYFASPQDWRDVPIYQLITDRYADGDPTNNDGNWGGYDLRYVDTRHGGDLIGLKNRLDYIKSLGYKAVWVSPVFQNMQNSYHGYAQVDFTLLDERFGTVEDFRALVNKAHSLGLYVIVDIVVNHMADLYQFNGYPNGGAPFRLHSGEHQLIPHNATNVYADFTVNNTFYGSGSYCDVYSSDGYRVQDSGGGSFWLSDFHHNGDLADYGDSWQNHLGKIYGIMDDLRTSHPRVQDKIIAMTKALVSSVDIDGIRMDTPMQVPMYFFQRWAPAVRAHAASLGKDNFFIFGEFFCSRGRAASMTGRGKEPSMYGNPYWFIGNEYTMDGGINYRGYFDFFMPAIKDQVNGNLGKLKESYLNDWYAYDFYNPAKNENQYRHLNFYNNHDQWRVSVAPDGFKKTDLGSAIIAFWPGIPLFYYGDEQGFCTMGTALDGWSREDMMANVAWNDVSAAVSPNPAMGDNFDMTSSHYLYVQKCMNIRQQYDMLEHTDTIYERWIQSNAQNGIYAYSRALGSNPADWALVAFNTWKDPIEAGGSHGDFWTGWNQGDVIVNLFNTNETYTLGWGGKLNSLWVGGYETKVFVRQDKVQALNPVVTAVTPAHDSVVSGSTVFTLTFSEGMDETSVKNAFRYDGQSVSAGALTWNAAQRQLSYTANVSAGVHKVEVLTSAQSLAGKNLIGAFSSRVRSGASDNIIAYANADWDDGLINSGAASTTNLSVTLTHKAAGAEKFRVLDELTGTWSAWQPYVSSSAFTLSAGSGDRLVTVQYYVDGSGAYFVTDEIEVPGAPPPVSNYSTMSTPGSFNGWNAGLNNMTLVANYTWEAVVTLNNQTNPEFKFAANGGWSANWGDCCQGDLYVPIAGEDVTWNHANIRLLGTLTGNFKITFHENTGTYDVVQLP